MIKSSIPDSSKRLRLQRCLVWFSLIETGLLILLSLRFKSAGGGPDGLLSQSFSVLMHVGHFGGWALAVLLVSSLLVLIYPRTWAVILSTGILALAVNTVVLVDSYVFSLYRFHLNAPILELLLGDAAGDIFVFSPEMLLHGALLLGGLCGATLFAIYLAWRLSSKSKGWRFEVKVIGLLVVSAFLQNLLYAWADATFYTPITRQAGLLPGYLPTTARRLLRGLQISPAPEEKLIASIGSRAELSYPLKPMKCASNVTTPNIIFIVIDSWRFDALTENITPNIATLLDQSLIFSNHISGGSATRTGIFTLFYGLPGTYWQKFLMERRGPVFLTELLLRSYAMGIFGSARLTSPEFDRTVFSEIQNLRLKSDGQTTVAHDLDINTDFLQFLDQQSSDRPFFSMLFYDAPHAFALPNDYPSKFTPSLEVINYLALNERYDPKPFFNRYLNSVHFVDNLIGNVLRELKEKNLFDNTILVFTGDHGQEFNESGLNYWGHNGNFTKYQTGVPLLISWPGKSAQTFEHRTSHFDIVPTLMQEVLRCENPMEDYTVGKSLFDKRDPSFLLLANYGDYALVEPDRINLVRSYGMIEVLTSDYRALATESPRQTIVQAALEQQTRFLKR